MEKVTQLPANVNIEFIQGDDFALDISIQDDNGNPIDFSNWSNLKLQVRDSQSSGGTQLQEYTGQDISSTNNGRVQVIFEASDTSTWPENVVYEVEGKDGNGSKRTIVRGVIRVVREISA